MKHLPRGSTAERIAAAARALLEQRGPDHVTMRNVAAAVGITAMAIYRHYGNREALLARIADDGFEELTDHLTRRKPAPSPAGQVLSLLEGYLDFARRWPRLFEFMFQGRRRGARRFPADFRAGRSPTGTLLVVAVEGALRAGIRTRADPWEVTVVLGAEALGLITLQLGDRFEISATEFRQLYRRALGRVLSAYTG